MSFQQQFVRFCCAGTLMILVLSCIFVSTESRTLSSNDFYPNTVLKRNSWWSKKSLNNLPEAQRQQEQDHFPIQPQSDCESVRDVYKCYADLCVPEFVTCSRTAITEDIFSMCKVEHTMCSARCFSGSTDDTK